MYVNNTIAQHWPLSLRSPTVIDYQMPIAYTLSHHHISFIPSFWNWKAARKKRTCSLQAICDQLAHCSRYDTIR